MKKVRKTDNMVGLFGCLNDEKNKKSFGKGVYIGFVLFIIYFLMLWK